MGGQSMKNDRMACRATVWFYTNILKINEIA